MAYLTRNYFYIGKYGDVDTYELDYTAENAALLNGASASADDILELVTITAYDSNNSGIIADNDRGIASETISYSVGGKAVSNIMTDSSMLAEVSVTLADGTVRTITTGIFQTANGDVFVGDNANNDLDGLNISSITINKVTSTTHSGWTASHTIEGASAAPTVTAMAICFAEGTWVETKEGPMLIETLMAGDKIKTMDRGFEEIVWIGKREICKDEIIADPRLRLVHIGKGALGDLSPKADLYVTRQHRIFIADVLATRLNKCSGLLIPAANLLQLEGVEIAEDRDEFTIYHILCRHHELIEANGAPCETLYLGDLAIENLPESAKEEIHLSMPWLLTRKREPKPARPIFRGEAAKRAVVATFNSEGQRPCANCFNTKFKSRDDCIYCLERLLPKGIKPITLQSLKSTQAQAWIS